MITKVISGGQTGADQAGLRAARRFGVETGGWAPRGWATEAGPAPWLAAYGLAECPGPGYPARTRRNVSESDATVFFGADGSGYAATYWAACECKRPFLHIPEDAIQSPNAVVDWLHDNAVVTLNVAGNRESKCPGINKWVEEYLTDVFRLLGFEEVTGG